MTLRMLGWIQRVRSAQRAPILAAGAIVAAGAISYQAEIAIANAIGIPDPLAYLFPVCIDGVAGVATVCLAEISKTRRWARAEVWLVILGAGVVSTLANGAHAPAGGLTLPIMGLTTNMLWSTIPAVGYAVALHLLGLLGSPPVPAAAVRGTAGPTGAPAAPAPLPARPARRAPRGRAYAGPRVMHNGREVSASHARKLRALERAQGGANAA